MAVLLFKALQQDAVARTHPSGSSSPARSRRWCAGASIRAGPAMTLPGAREGHPNTGVSTMPDGRVEAGGRLPIRAGGGGLRPTAAASAVELRPFLADQGGEVEAFDVDPARPEMPPPGSRYRSKSFVKRSQSSRTSSSAPRRINTRRDSTVSGGTGFRSRISSSRRNSMRSAETPRGEGLAAERSLSSRPRG